MIATRRARHLKPRSIGSIVLWLDASNDASLYDATSGGSLSANGAAVARWQDLSGNADHCTQVSASNKPTRQDAAINAKRAVRFDGGDYLTATTAVLSLAAADRIIVAVYSKPNTLGFATNQRIFSTPGTTTADFADGYLLNLSTNAVVSPSVISTYGNKQMRGYALANEWSYTQVPGINTFGGDIGEIICIAATMTSALQKRLRHSLAAKWKVSAS